MQPKTNIHKLSVNVGFNSNFFYTVRYNFALTSFTSFGLNDAEALNST